MVYIWMPFIAIVLAFTTIVGRASYDPALETIQGEVGEDPTLEMITVGSKNFTEQLILGQIAVLLLEDAGFEIRDRTGLGDTSEVRKALETGEIDLYWEYTGTALAVHLGYEGHISDPQECFKRVKEMDVTNGLAWLEPAPFNNTYAIIMLRENAEAAGLVTISDLAERINEGEDSLGDWVLAAGYEYILSPDGYPGLRDLYGFTFDDLLMIMDPVLIYEAIRDGSLVAGVGFATDAYLSAFDLVHLVDDRNFHPFYHCAPVVRIPILEQYPSVEETLLKAVHLLDEAAMSALNASVDLGGKEPHDAAREWLLSEGLLLE